MKKMRRNRQTESQILLEPSEKKEWKNRRNSKN
jgi:hypothetical protein